MEWNPRNLKSLDYLRYLSQKLNRDFPEQVADTGTSDLQKSRQKTKIFT
jgi:hypothetical protein